MSGRNLCKPGSSCCQKVVAFNQWPAKTAWRDVSRGLETLVKRLGGGVEFWRLRDLHLALASTFASLEPPAVPYCRCEFCGGPKHPWKGLTAGAGRMFEPIDASSEIAAARDACDRANAVSGENTVTVVRHRATTHIFLRRAVGVFGWCFRCNVVNVGDVVVEMAWVPIGVYTSKVSTSCVLDQAQTRWR